DVSEDRADVVEGRPTDTGAVVDVRSSMPGRVVRVAVAVGAHVDRGQTLVVLEAMKMQNEIPSPGDGVVREVAVAEGEIVTADPEHARGTLVAPEIRGEPEDPIRIDRVEAVVLEMVRRHLVDDPDAPSLLGEVQQDALRGAPESLHRGIELLTAVASLRSEDIARH